MDLQFWRVRAVGPGHWIALVATCRGVPYDVRFQMVENLKEISMSKEQTKKDQEASNYSPLEDLLEFEDVQEVAL